MEKHCMPYHWPLRATKVATSILAIQTLAFLPKMILLQSGDHCDLKFKYKPHLSKYKNKLSGKTLHVWSLTTESNKDSHQYTKNSNLSFSSKNDTFTIWTSLWSAI